MCTEIEAKLKIESPTEVERILAELGAEFVSEQSQIDRYFDDANDTLTKTDSALRIRRQAGAETSRSFLTYKGPREESNFKKRREIEFDILDADAAGKLLSALGYHEALTVEKTRRLWRFGDCDVALDRLALLGDFVEIEGPDDEKINSVQSSLGLSDLPHIVKSYATLTRAKVAELGRQRHDAAR